MSEYLHYVMTPFCVLDSNERYSFFCFCKIVKRFRENKKSREIFNREKKMKKAIQVPPSYTNVQIFPRSSKVAWVGYDSNGKLQSGYTPQWRKRADHRKFCGMLPLLQSWDKLSKIVDKWMKSSNEIQREMGLVFRLLMQCHFRIGSKKNKRSDGITSLKSHHLKRSPRSTQVKFIGKSQMVNTCEMDSTFHMNRKGYLFPNVEPGLINKWLHDNIGESVSAKTFRDVAANVLFIRNLMKNSEQTLKQNIKEALKSTAMSLHNTPHVLQHHYIVPELIDWCMNDTLEFYQWFSKGNVMKRLLLWLQEICFKKSR